MYLYFIAKENELGDLKQLYKLQLHLGEISNHFYVQCQREAFFSKIFKKNPTEQKILAIFNKQIQKAMSQQAIKVSLLPSIRDGHLVFSKTVMLSELIIEEKSQGLSDQDLLITF